MKKHWPQVAAFLIFTLGALRVGAGTIFYVPISPTESDANSGISTDNGYTSAVDGGNTHGNDRVINGITLYALEGNGETSTADNCTLNALSGSLANGGGTTKSIQVDGTLKEVASDMTFNNGASDNSQQEIVLDPESLEAGTTYDLRVYISNGSGQNRQVNLAFFGDGQEGVETGFFNEDDARTSAGGFKDPNQAYYINYRYTWDGDSTPGITITQKSGSAPFCLYALTNQVVPSAGVADSTGSAEGGEEGLSAGFVNAESDEVGVESDDFYSSDSLNSNGRWVKLDKWGTCWQPTNVPAGWSPYTNGNWKNCDDCGWIFDSPEPWAWACYHYGRWAKVRTGCGWAWVPGKVWGPSWVSWRQGRSGSSCETCIGWAPLPPEADCELGVGISSWVDYTSDIGPDCYTFINIRDFGADSYSGCGTCILDRGTYINIVEQTTNITNISYDRHVNIYSGGPDYNWCNTEIRKYGGKECEKVHVNRYDDPGKLGGKYAHKEGNQLALVSPKIKGNKNAKQPKVAESLGSDKIDKGWGSAKANNKEKELKNHIAQETRGKTPKNTKGTLPPGVAELQKKHRGGPGQAGAGAGQAATQQLGGKGQHPGKGGKKGLGTQAAAGQAGAGLDQHPRGKGKLKGQGQLGAAGAGQAAGDQAGAGLDQHPGKGKLKGQGQLGAAGAGQAAGGGFDQHPGKKGKLKGQGQLGAAGGGQAAGGGLDQQAGGKTKGKGQGKLGGAPGATSEQAAAGGFGKSGRHPGQSLKGSKKGQTGLDAQKKEGPQGAKQGAQVQGFQPGKQGIQGKGQGVQQGQPQALGGQAQGGQGQGQGLAGKGGKGKHKQQQQLQQSQGQPQTYGQAAGGGQGGGGKAKHKQQQQAQQFQQPQGQPQTYGQAAGGGQGGGGKAKHKQQQQAQQFQQPQAQPQTYGQAAGGGQGGGGKAKHKQQQQAQQFQQPQGQQQTYGQAAGGGQGGGGKGKHKQQQQAQQFQQQAQQQQLQQQQAQQQQRQLQQQQAQQQQLQQQQQGGKKGKKKPTPPPY